MSNRCKIKIRAHPLFFLVIFISLITGLTFELFTLFSIILLHEFGHVACAKYFKWNVTEIQLLPFGGVMHTSHQHFVPLREEIIVALCGPLQHLWLIVFVKIAQSWKLVDPVWCEYVIEANLYIALLNLVPILPLDGGRIFQSICSYGISYYQALRWSVLFSIGLSMCILCYVMIQFYYHMMPLNLLVLGVFLLSTNLQNYRQIPYTFWRFILQRANSTNLNPSLVANPSMLPIRVNPNEYLYSVIKKMRKEKKHEIVVVYPNGKSYARFTERQVIDYYLHANRIAVKIGDLR